MQSGISASAELQTALQTFLSHPSQRGLLATIEKESVVPVTTIESTSSDFSTDLSNLTPHLKPDAALYILLRSSLTSSDPGSLIAITYVPNAAPVRQKMLFASSRLQLLRDLGSELFGETVFCTEASDLSAQGWEKHLKHGEAANPLTKEEEELVGIREAEALESGGMGGRGLVQAGRIETRVGGDVVSALKALVGADDGMLVQLHMNVGNESLELASVSETDVAGLAGAIHPSEHRFSFYKVRGHVLFISSCPSAAKVKERMLYAASRRNVLNIAEQEAGIKVEKRLEVTNPDEVTVSVVEDEFKTGQVEEKKAFARPKRPGKR